MQNRFDETFIRRIMKILWNKKLKWMILPVNTAGTYIRDFRKSRWSFNEKIKMASKSKWFFAFERDQTKHNLMCYFEQWEKIWLKTSDWNAFISNEFSMEH